MDGGAAAFSGGKVFTYRCNLGVRLADVVAGQKPKIGRLGREALFNGRTLETPLATRDLLIAATEKGTLEARKLPDEKSDEPAERVWEWKSESGAGIWTAPAAAGGFIVLGSDDGQVYAFSYGQQQQPGK